MEAIANLIVINEGGDSRNFTSYNFQVIRDDIFMLARRHGDRHKVAPFVRSAVLVISRNQNREWIYHQQQTFSRRVFGADI